MVGILIVCHGKIAVSIFDTLKMILGDVSDISFINFSSQDSLEVLESKINTEIDKIEGVLKEVLIFVDLFGGSCANLSTMALKNHKNIHIICGVNLPMILEAYFRRKELNGSELAEKVVETGRKSIFEIKLDK